MEPEVSPYNPEETVNTIVKIGAAGRGEVVKWVQK